MNKWLAFFVVLLSSIAGLLFFLIQGQYVLIKLPWFSYPLVEKRADRPAEVQRDVVCQVSRQGLTIQVKKTILWPQNQSEAIKRLVELWVAAGVEEGAVAEEAKIHSVALTHQGTVALIAFEKTFILPHLSTVARWQLVESLLQTLRTAGVVLEGVYFVQGQHFLQDDYLDFSQRWPIGGYQS